MLARAISFIGIAISSTAMAGPALRNEQPSPKPIAIPSYFEQNLGQSGTEVRYLSRGSGYSVFLTEWGAGFSLPGGSPDRRTALRMTFLGARKPARVEGEGKLAGASNYLLGRDATRWVHSAPHYDRVRLHGVRRGVDAIFYHSERQLEYDLVLEPGARAGGLGVRFEGQRKLSIQDGEIVLETDSGQMRQRKPTAWQEIDGVRRPVTVEYALDRRGEVRFRLGEYDQSRPLRIDPVIVYATYLPALPFTMAVNSAGEVYLTGTFDDADRTFPVTVGAYDVTANGLRDAFVLKLDASGSTVLLATYLGGSQDDNGVAIVLDAVGNIYVAGHTKSPDFPTTYDARTGTSDNTAFLTKLSASGSALLYSVLLDEAYYYKQALAVDANYSAYLAVKTTSFTTTAGAFRSTCAGGMDIGLAKLNPAGSALMYATFLGGSSDEDLGDITIDATGAVYVSGTTWSSDFPTTSGAYRTTLSGYSNAFVAKLNPSASGASSLIFSTYLGGSGYDQGYAIALDPPGNVYVGGETSSADFPTTPGAYSASVGYYNAFVTKLNPSGTGLVYSARFGGSYENQVWGIKVDALGNAIIFGTTWGSTGFPTTPGAVMQYVGSSYPMFLTVLGPDGGSLTSSAVIGPMDNGWPRALAYDGHSAYLLGRTSSPAPTTAGSYRPDWRGVDAAYLMKVDLDSPVLCTFSLSPGFWDIPATGGDGWFDVTAPAGCAPFAHSSPAQVSFANSSPFVGSGRLDFSVPPTGAGAATQLYTVTVGDATATVRQAPGECSAVATIPSPVSFSAAGGQRDVQVVTPDGCDWRTAPMVGWLTVISKYDRTITLHAEPNSFEARTGTLTISDGAVTVYQEGGSCSLTLSSTTAWFGGAGGTGGIPFSTSSSGCSWSAWTNENWLRIDSVSGTGSSALTFAVMANLGGLARTGTVYLSGRAVTVTQAAGTGATADVYWISTFAGGGFCCSPGDGGSATSGWVNYPQDVAFDQTGNLLVAEYTWGRVRKVTPNAVITTLIGGGMQDSGEGVPALLVRILYLTAVAVAPNGTVHFAEPSRIRKLDADGKIYTVAGTGSSTGPVGDNGPATSATLVSVGDIAFDSAGNLYIADSGSHRVRRVDPSGAITTVAGTGSYGFSGDGDLATAATLWWPSGVLADTSGDLYISDNGNNRIRKVGADGKINTIAGTGATGFGGDGGSAALATLSSPRGLAWDTTGNLVFADTGNNRIRRIDSLGVITTIAGNGQNSYSGDGGPALSAGLYVPLSVVGDNAGNLYYAERNSDRVRKLAPTRFCAFTVAPSTVTTLAAAGGPLSFTVTPDSASCAWNASTSAGWLTINSGSTGIGNGTVSVTVATNYGGPRRTGTLIVAGQVFTETQAAGVGALRFVPMAPCRVADTRLAAGPFGGPAITANTSRDFEIPAGSCGIPSTALAYSFNVTAVPSGPLLYVSMWPTGETQPVVSTLNALDGRWTANAAIVPAGANGSVSVFASDATNVVLDINGYFVPAATSGALSFYPLTPCRVMDTRSGAPIAAGGTRTAPVSSSSCSVPSGAVAYSLNFTAAPRGPLGWITTWPTGSQMPTASTLNAPTGAITPNAAILPAGTNGSVDVYASDATDLLVDINGYFAPPGTGGLSFYPLTPCRVADTRNAGGAFGGPALNGTRDYAVPSSACGAPSGAQAYSLNATVWPATGFLNWLTLWPTGGAMPGVSTLNSWDGRLVANAAIVPTTTGSISAYASDLTTLIFDINGYFAP